MLIQWLVLLSVSLWPILSHAQYEVRIIDVPFSGARQTEVTGITLGHTIGLYQDAREQTQGFLALCPAETVPLPLLIPRAASAAGIVGWYTAPSGHTTGFLLQDGTFTALLGPLGKGPGPDRVPTFSEALDINSAGVTVGTYRRADGVSHGFRYEPGAQLYTTLDVPEAASGTAAIAIANDGRMLLKAFDSETSVRYVLWDNGTLTALTLPDLPQVELIGRTENGRLVGNTTAQDGTISGFLFDGTTLEFFTVPDAVRTQLFGVRDEILVGRYTDTAGGHHGFIAFPEGTAEPCAEAAPDEKRKRKHR